MPGSPVTKVVDHLRGTVLRQEEDRLSDGTLLDRFLELRDEAAFATLVRRHGPMVWGVCRRIVGHVHDAEDAFQAAFVILVRKASAVKPREAVGNWLYGVACHTALKARTASIRVRAKEKQVTRMPEPPTKPRDDREELLRLLDQELSALPDKYRLPVVLCDLEGRTRKDVAARLKIPEGTLSSRRATAHQMLAKRLARHGLAVTGGSLADLFAQDAASACVPASVVSATIKTATLVAASNGPVAGVVSTKVAALTEGVMKAMLLMKLKTLTAVLGVLGIILLGGGLVYQQTVVGQQAGAEKTDEPKKIPETPKLRSDKEALQGRWKVVAWEVDGWREPTEDFVGVRITGDKIFIKQKKGGIQEETFALDETRKPKHIDWMVLAGENKGLVARGIYRLDGDNLVFCIGHMKVNRPTEFTTEPGSEFTLMVLQREKPIVPPESGDKQPEKADEKPKGDAGRPVHTLFSHSSRLTSVAYAPDGRSIATVSWDGTARLWDAKTGKEVHRVDFPDTKGYNTVHQIAFSPDSAFIVTLVRESTDECVIIVWDRSMREKVCQLPGWRFAISPDGKHIACGQLGVSPFIRLYELASGKFVRGMTGPYSRVDLLTFAPDGKTLYAQVGIPRPPLGGDVERMGRNGAQVRVWDVATGKERRTGLEGAWDDQAAWNEHHMTLTPDGRTIAVKGPGGPKSISHNHAGGNIELRETAGGGRRIELTGHTDDVMDVTFSPDGRTLASASMDKTVRLWDRVSGKEIGRLEGHTNWVLSIAFSPDGGTLVSGGLDKTALVWDVSKITRRRDESAERSAAELEADWTDLGGDAAKAYAALGRLISSPKQAVAFLGKHLQSAKPADTRRIEQLIGNVGDDRFEVREQATKELVALGEWAEPLLQKALAGNLSLEARRRLETLLDRLEGGRLSAETLCHVRAVEALELIGNVDAVRLLEKLAAGPADMRLTQEALASARRLARRFSDRP